MASDFDATRKLFHLPDGLIYLDGNSLGPLPLAAVDKVAGMMRDEWGDLLIKGWNAAGWMDFKGLGNRVGRLIGAEPDHVILGDTLSIKVYQALAAGLEMVPERRVILSDTGNFPSDLYMAQGLTGLLKQGYTLKTVAPEDVAGAIDETVAVLMLTQVDYRTGRLHDMASLTRAAHANGAITVWDLAHSAGAIPVDLSGCNADFAVGCTYKYLNGGPGSPAFIYVAPRHADVAKPALSGWLGHEAPFDFDLDYRAHAGIARMRVGTPPVIALKSLEAALDIWDLVEMAEVRARSIELTSLLVDRVEAACPDLTLASPRDPLARGSQVSFAFEHGYAAMQALIARGVIGDFRAPDVMRFGFTPLYTTEKDVLDAVAILAEIMDNRLWDNPEYQTKSAVT